MEDSNVSGPVVEKLDEEVDEVPDDIPLTHGMDPAVYEMPSQSVPVGEDLDEAVEEKATADDVKLFQAMSNHVAAHCGDTGDTPPGMAVVKSILLLMLFHATFQKCNKQLCVEIMMCFQLL